MLSFWAQVPVRFPHVSIDEHVVMPNHVHLEWAIKTAQAGKHVLCEKPLTINAAETQEMLDAVAKTDVLLMEAFMYRCHPQTHKLVELVRDGTIGEVLIAKHVNSQKRANIGHVAPSEPPKHLDYDLWVGPAEWREYQSNYLHYHWHWFYNFGTGDIGNDGVHDVDYARWGLGVETLPSRISAMDLSSRKKATSSSRHGRSSLSSASCSRLRAPCKSPDSCRWAANSQ